MKHRHEPLTDCHGIHQLTQMEWLDLTGGWVEPQRDYWEETRGEMPYSVWTRGLDEEARR
jgi:hypothetical protein